jgi:hypothetical protein
MARISNVLMIYGGQRAIDASGGDGIEIRNCTLTQFGSLPFPLRMYLRARGLVDHPNGLGMTSGREAIRDSLARKMMRREPSDGQG